MGVGSLGGGIAVSFIIGFLPVSALLVQSFATGSAGLACALSSLVSTSMGLYFFITMYSALVGGLSSASGSTLMMVVEKEQLPHASGQLILVSGIPIMIGPPAGGNDAIVLSFMSIELHLLIEEIVSLCHTSLRSYDPEHY